MTIIQVDLSGVLDAPWSARRAGKVGRNPEPIEALERAAADVHVAYCEANAAYDAWVEAGTARDDLLAAARHAGWSLATIAEAARLGVRDQRIRDLKNPGRTQP